MYKLITYFHSLKRNFHENEFENNNPRPSKHERIPDIQVLSSKINTTIDEQKNHLLDGKFYKIISITQYKMSVN
jgi:hypothetical protein